MKQVLVGNKKYVMQDMRTLVTVEKDNAYHADGTSANESWYLAAHLNRNDERIGVQYHALIMRVDGVPPIFALNINIVHEMQETYKSIDLYLPLDQVAVATDSFRVEGENFRFEGGPDRVECYFLSEECGIDLVATATHPVLKYLGEGYGNFLGAAQYGYSFPAMKANGLVRLEGTSYSVDGIAWYDRQWGDLPDYFIERILAQMTGQKLAESEIQSSGRSTFYNPQLSNGVVMSLGEVYQDDEGIYTYNATILEPDGTIILLELMPPTYSDYWSSEVTGHRYPTRFKFELTQVDAELMIEVPFKPQQIVSEVGGMTKYEGAARVSGTYRGEPVTGDCYVELAGDWF